MKENFRWMETPGTLMRRRFAPDFYYKIDVKIVLLIVNLLY